MVSHQGHDAAIGSKVKTTLLVWHDIDGGHSSKHGGWHVHMQEHTMRGLDVS